MQISAHVSSGCVYVCVGGCAAEWAAVTGGCHWLPLRVCPTECRAVFACKYPVTQGRLAEGKDVIQMLYSTID